MGHSCHCIQKFSKYLTDELRDILPLLDRTARGRPGVFLEIGAFDGMDGSQSFLLERCFGWSGLLVEAQPSTFERLKQSPRTSTKIWAAACPDGDSIEMMNMSAQVAGNIHSLPDPGVIARMSRKTHTSVTTVSVPCRPLSSMMRDSGVTMFNFASIDVQGAELIVLRTVDLRKIQVLLVEAEGMDRRSQKRIAAVHRYLRDYGFVQYNVSSKRVFHGGYNELFIRSDLHHLHHPWSTSLNCSAQS
jgi:FkbM family methyltransferase